MRISIGDLFFEEEGVAVAEAGELAAEAVDFALEVFDAGEHVADGVDALDVDGEVIVEVAVALQVAELRVGEAGLPVDVLYLNQAAFFEEVEEVAVGMAFFAVFVDDNPILFHGTLFWL